MSAQGNRAPSLNAIASFSEVDNELPMGVDLCLHQNRLLVAPPSTEIAVPWM